MGTHTDIRWQRWGDAAFAEARKAGKPVLLDLSAVWCHWCHVMDETSYADDEIIQLINDEFVPIRVDIDRRPDIRERYNFGGYPTTAFLDAEGNVIAGGTYIPPDQMKRTLVQVKGYVAQGGDVARRRVAPESELTPATGDLSLDVVQEVLGHVLQQHDDLHGGFGTAPKFPQPEVLDLALYQYRLTGNRQFQRLAEKTLEGMAGRGMYDPVEGGFYRYSVTRDWSEPHYEKMLDVNAGLLRTYLNAYAVTREERYRAVAEDVLRYMEATLRDPKGGFYGSQDADEEYYGLSAEERKEATPPYVDETLYTDLNGQAISSYLRAAAVLGEERYRQAAESTLDVLWERVAREEGRLHHYWDGAAQMEGLLGDYVDFGHALFEAHEASGEDVRLQQGKAVADAMLEELRDENGVLIDRSPSDSDIGLLRNRRRPLIENAHAASLLLKLHELLPEEGYREAAGAILTGMSGQYVRYGLFAAPYAVALRTYLMGSVRLVLVGSRGEGATDGMRDQLLAPFEPRRVVQLLEPGTSAFEAAQYPTEPVPAVYACVGTQCSAPLTGADLVPEIEAYVATVDAQSTAPS